MNPIVDTYSRLAAQYDYDEDKSTRSCWGIAGDKLVGSLRLKDNYGVIVDVGCGTGKALLDVARRIGHPVRLIGVEPAANMRKRASELTKQYPDVHIVDGSFEKLPLESQSVDYIYSMFAFHWTTDLVGSVRELVRVLKPQGEMDLFFIGRNNGYEFIRKTTPIFLKYMGPRALLESAAMRKQLTREAVALLFEQGFDKARLVVEESQETYFDTLEGHWNWWVRVEGHFVQIPAHKKTACDQEVKHALAELQTEAGIPYTIHLLHVKVRCPEA